MDEQLANRFHLLYAEKLRWHPDSGWMIKRSGDAGWTPDTLLYRHELITLLSHEIAIEASQADKPNRERLMGYARYVGNVIGRDNVLDYARHLFASRTL